MLTPQQLQSLPKPLTDVYEELSEFVLRDIARRIAGAARITDTAEYQLYRARALGMSTKEITEKIAKINGVSEEKIGELILDAAEKSNEFDVRMLTGNDGAAIALSENEQLQKLMAAQIKQTNGTCQNLTGTLGFAERNAYGQVVYSSLTDFLRKQMDMAQMKVATGVTDYNTAIRQACNALAESGLRTVYYASGRSDRIEVAVRRALMTSVSQITQKISEQNAAEFGADGWEISAHVGARPSHAVYQGRQYPNSQYETIVLPLINDYNCRHSAYPIIMGVTNPSYTEEQLAALDPPPFTYEGKQYTAYKAQQQMRYMERKMRKQKDLCVAYQGASQEEAFTAASIKLRRQKDIYEDFCKAAGTFTEYERTFVAGYNRRLGARTGAITRAQNRQKNLQIPLTELDKGGIISIDKFTPVDSISKAEDFARDILKIPNVSYKGVDITTANEWNKGLFETFRKFPELHDRFGFVGECHERNAALKPVVQQYYMDAYRKRYPDVDLEELQPYIDKAVNKQMRALSVSRNTLAQSFSPLIDDYKPFSGISVNRDAGKSSVDFIDSLKRNVLSSFHPEGCDTIRSVLDHEIGHQLDSMLGISQIKDIQELFTSRTTDKLTTEISRYSWDNDNANIFAEMIAEGWAEYCNNPKPREIAKKIGDIIEAEYKKKFGKR